MSEAARPDGTIDILLVEDNPADARFVRMVLTSSTSSKFTVTESAIEGSTHRGESAVALAMCSGCRKLRAASGRWETFEEYLAPLVQAQLSYESCPDCVAQLTDETPEDDLTRS
jgi:hypothetical protein